MRFVWGLLVIGCLIFGADDAFGKDKKKKKKDKDEGIMMTGITAFDSVFVRVGEIDQRLAASEAHLRTGKSDLNTALELKRGTPISTGLAELQERAQGKVSLAMNNQAVPKLKTEQAVPSNVQNAVDAVNAMTGNFSASLVELKTLAPEIDKLVKETRKMPSRLKDEFEGGALEQLFTLPKVSKALTHDIGITTGLADRTTSVTTRMTDVLGVVQSEFGRGSAKPRPGTGTGRKPGPKKKK